MQTEQQVSSICLSLQQLKLTPEAAPKPLPLLGNNLDAGLVCVPFRLPGSLRSVLLTTHMATAHMASDYVAEATPGQKNSDLNTSAARLYSDPSTTKSDFITHTLNPEQTRSTVFGMQHLDPEALCMYPNTRSTDWQITTRTTMEMKGIVARPL